MAAEEMRAKIDISVGKVHIQYEGPESFLKESLPGLIKQLCECVQESGE